MPIDCDQFDVIRTLVVTHEDDTITDLEWQDFLNHHTMCSTGRHVITPPTDDSGLSPDDLPSLSAWFDIARRCDALAREEASQDVGAQQPHHCDALLFKGRSYAILPDSSDNRLFEIAELGEADLFPGDEAEQAEESFSVSLNGQLIDVSLVQADVRPHASSMAFHAQERLPTIAASSSRLLVPILRHETKPRLEIWVDSTSGDLFLYLPDED